MQLITHADCLEHKMMPGSPERPERLSTLLRYLHDSGLQADLDTRLAQPVDLQTLSSVHDETFLQSLNAALPDSGLFNVDPDTAMGPGSLRAAALAAGAVTGAVAEVLCGNTQRAFCAVRPPGHHAEADTAMGFCFYNSIALGAITALEDDAIERVAILDFDVHHGNGTVDIFKDTPQVLVCSSFQHPFYPHRYTDIVRDNIVNTPLPAGTDSSAFRTAVERDWTRAVEAHRPQFILVSAGFDAHRDDPLAELLLEDEDFRWITELIVDLANRFCEGRIVSALEGGYDLNALSRSAHAHIEVLSGV
ncbi:MAG: histone deacetylase family protein [Gammaproteobacteria bacterium]|nr:MAG: histone deacetylase family protein [Gammaproteobacteria bacterium]